ncbi:hevamine-A-like [Ziziphus jujuba]|uniref:Hevamine-A-like n=2 Tax=Ziziphus jujuba TaxID=326968 RepID=A0A6P3ZHV7_ZIZJJ|nr:hevamine-A-like [Ziziphus jujuba]
MAPLAKLLGACLMIFLSSTLIQNSEASNGGIATYWGQYTEEAEGSLAEVCNTMLYSYISVAFLNRFGSGQDLGFNISGHCSCESDCSSCIRFGEDIKTCQSKDFHIENGSPLCYDYLARALKKYGKDHNKMVYLSAAPRCLYPDLYLGRAIYTGLFDFVWVHFFNTSSACQYDSTTGDDVLMISWNAWTTLIEAAGKLFLGVPASDDVFGYIPPDAMNDKILPEINRTSKYGGVMVWNRYYDVITNFSPSIINQV